MADHNIFGRGAGAEGTAGTRGEISTSGLSLPYDNEEGGGSGTSPALQVAGICLMVVPVSIILVFLLVRYTRRTGPKQNQEGSNDDDCEAPEMKTSSKGVTTETDNATVSTDRDDDLLEEELIWSVNVKSERIGIHRGKQRKKKKKKKKKRQESRSADLEKPSTSFSLEHVLNLTIPECGPSEDFDNEADDASVFSGTASTNVGLVAKRFAFMLAKSEDQAWALELENREGKKGLLC